MSGTFDVGILLTQPICRLSHITGLHHFFSKNILSAHAVAAVGDIEVCNAQRAFDAARAFQRGLAERIQERRPTSINKVGERLLGRSRDDIIG